MNGSPLSERTPAGAIFNLEGRWTIPFRIGCYILLLGGDFRVQPARLREGRHGIIADHLQKSVGGEKTYLRGLRVAACGGELASLRRRRLRPAGLSDRQRQCKQSLRHRALRPKRKTGLLGRRPARLKEPPTITTLYSLCTTVLHASTNAPAESFKAKVKAFRNQFRGVSDIPFFIYLD